MGLLNEMKRIKRVRSRRREERVSELLELLEMYGFEFDRYNVRGRDLREHTDDVIKELNARAGVLEYKLNRWLREEYPQTSAG